MKSMLRETMTKIIILLFSAAMIMLSTVPVYAAENSAVISLRVNGHEVNSFFEVLMRDTEILVPLVELANLTDTLVSWNLKEGTASFSRLSDDITCVIDINAALMIIGMNEPVALNPVPAVHNAMPYVPLMVVREALGYAAEWDFVNQTLDLTIDAYKGDRHQSENLSGISLSADRTNGSQIHGPLYVAFSLSSDLKNTDWHLKLGAPFGIPGVPLDWRFALVGGSTIQPFALKELALNYQSEQLQLVLGDYTLGFPGFLSETYLRGVAFGIPEVSEKEMSYQKYNWSGMAPVGAIAQLYIDEMLYESVEVSDGEFSFRNIPLKAFGTTLLILKIINPDGTVYETIAREVSAAPLTEEYGSSRFTAAFGMLANKAWFEPETQYLLGTDWRYGIQPWLTGRIMFVRSAPVKETSPADSPFINNLVNGSLLFYSDHTSVNLDLMYGNNRQPSLAADSTQDIGARATVRWSGAKFGIQGTIYYFGPHLYLPGSEKPENRYGGNLTAAWNPVQGSLLNFWYNLESEPTSDSIWVHHLSLRYNQSFNSGFSFGTQARMWHDPSNPNPWGSVFSLAGSYFGRRLTAKTEANLRWSLSEEEGSRYTFSGEANVTAIFSDASKLGAKLYGTVGASTATKLGGTLRYDLPVAQDHFLGFTLDYLSPNRYFLPLSERATSVSAGITWRAYWQRNALSSVGLTGIFLAGDDHYEFFPEFKVTLSDKSGSDWKAEVAYTARPAAPSLTISLKFNKSLLLFPGAVTAVPEGIAGQSNIVAGVIFRDDNGNGRQDSGEPGIAGLTVELGPWKTVTDLQGIYIFRGIEPGEYSLRVLPASIPIQYSLAGGPWLVTVEDQTSLWHEIPLSFWGTASGYVYLDQNGNGVFDEADQPLPGVQILINGEPSGIYTDALGFYYLEGLAIGTYILTLDTVTLPEIALAAETGDDDKDIAVSVAITGITIEISVESPDHADCDFGVQSINAMANQ